MSLHHPDTEFFSQGIVLIITLWRIIERKCWGRVRWGELIQSSDPHLQLRRGHQNKLRASCAEPGWAKRWSLDLGRALRHRGASGGNWGQTPGVSTVHLYSGLSLVSSPNTGLWLAELILTLRSDNRKMGVNSIVYLALPRSRIIHNGHFTSDLTSILIYFIEIYSFWEIFKMFRYLF